MSSNTTCAESVNTWVLPTSDVACAIKSTSGNYTSIMDKCCGVADVEQYNDDCGLYCLAQGQDQGSLLDCIADNGAKDGDFFCGGGKLNETASAAVPSPTSSSGADDEDSEDSEGSDAEPTETDNAAAGLRVQREVVSKGGLAALAVVFCSVVLGAGVVV